MNHTTKAQRDEWIDKARSLVQLDTTGQAAEAGGWTDKLSAAAAAAWTAYDRLVQRVKREGVRT